MGSELRHLVQLWVPRDTWKSFTITQRSSVDYGVTPSNKSRYRGSRSRNGKIFEGKTFDPISLSVTENKPPSLGYSRRFR